MEKTPCQTKCKVCGKWFRSTLDSKQVRCDEHQREYDAQVMYNRINMPEDLYQAWKATGYDPAQEPVPAPGEVWIRTK